MTPKSRLRVGMISNVIKDLIYSLASSTIHGPTSGIKAKVIDLSRGSLTIRRNYKGHMMNK